MAKFSWSQLKREAFEPEHSAAVGSMIRGRKIGVGRFTYPAGTSIKAHANRCERIQTILKGRTRFRVAKEEKVVGPGEAVLIRPNTEYSAEVLDEMEIVSFEDVGPVAGGRLSDVKPTAFYTWSEMTSDFITPSYSNGQGPVVTGERIEVAFMTYAAGGGGKPHSHPNEQIQVILGGTSRSRIGDEVNDTGPGDVVLMPPFTEHEGKVLTDKTVINCKDIVPNWSVYHAKWTDR